MFTLARVLLLPVFLPYKLPLISILYRDDYILAVNKPSGLLSIPDGYHKEIPNLKKLLESDIPRVWTVHRLDKETSGIVLFALNADAHRNLSLQFEKRLVKKTYLALVTGALPNDSMNIDIPLKVNGDRRHRTVPDFSEGKTAQTDIERIKTYQFFTLVKAYPKTGYPHQIRAHLQHVGHPIINDILYGFTPLPNDCGLIVTRLMLHALCISFEHPDSGKQMLLQAPEPEEFCLQ